MLPLWSYFRRVVLVTFGASCFEERRLEAVPTSLPTEVGVPKTTPHRQSEQLAPLVTTAIALPAMS